jgi:hypothetical protein
MGTEVGGAKKNVMTPKFRVSYPYVFKPQKPMQPGGEEKYGVTMLFPKGADLTALKQEAARACIEKWGADKTKWPTNMRSPFRDQKEKVDKAGKIQTGHEAGAIFITATSKAQPGLVDSANQSLLQEKDFYAGCYARATVRAFAYDKAGNRGVSFGLQNVQKLSDGEPLGGRAKPEDEFEPVADESEAVGAGSPHDIF